MRAGRPVFSTCLLLGRLYHTPAVVNEFRVLSHRLVPEAWPKGVLARWTEVHGADASKRHSTETKPALKLLWRQADADVWKLVQERSDPLWQGTRCVLLRGPPGSGKSTSLFHAVERAREQDWLVFYLPNLYHWLHERDSCDVVLTPRPRGARSASLLREPLFFDQARLVLDSLQACRQVHARTLESITCLPTEQLLRESDLDDEARDGDVARQTATSTDQHTNLLGLVDACLQSGRRLEGELAELNLDAFGRTYRLFLRQLQCVRQVPVLFAIDDWNLLNALTSIRHPQKKGRFLHASALRSLRPLNAWNMFTRFGARMRRGLVLCAETSARGLGRVRASRVVGSVLHRPTPAMQRDPDGSQAARWVDQELPSNLQPVIQEIPRFHSEEIQRILKDFQDHKVFHAVDAHTLWRLERLASGNGVRLLRICQSI